MHICGYLCCTIYVSWTNFYKKNIDLYLYLYYSAFFSQKDYFSLVSVPNAIALL